MARILVADDEENIRFLVASALKTQSHTVEQVPDGSTALRSLSDGRFDLAVLDLNMPGLDGFAVLERMQARAIKTPVIFLTARDGVEDRVRGLRGGGQDYVVKPFSLEELLARVDLVLSRTGLEQAQSVLRLDNLVLDIDAHRVTRGEHEITLSPTEFKLLRVLLDNAGRVLSRNQIVEDVWDFAYDGDASVIETYVSYLRKKIDFCDPKLIHTVRGVGYVMRVDTRSSR